MLAIISVDHRLNIVPDEEGEFGAHVGSFKWALTFNRPITESWGTTEGKVAYDDGPGKSAPAS